MHVAVKTVAVQTPITQISQEQQKQGQARRKTRGNRKRKRPRFKQVHSNPRVHTQQLEVEWKIAPNVKPKAVSVTECQKQAEQNEMEKQTEITKEKELGTPDLSHTVLRVLARVDGLDVVVLIDAGASHDFMSKRLAKRLGLKTTETGAMNIKFGDGRSRMQEGHKSEAVVLAMDNWIELREFNIISHLADELVLGKPWLTRWNPTIDWRQNHLSILDEERGTVTEIEAMRDKVDPTLQFISATQANKALRRGDEAFVVWVLNSEMSDEKRKYTIQCENAKQKQQVKTLLESYEDCLPESVTTLPPKRHVNHRIDVVPGASPPHRKPFRLSQPQMVELKKVLEKLVEKGYIRPSVSPFGAPVFFVPKPDGTLRFICDWRQLNKITIKNKACIPNVDDLFDRVQGAKFFSHMDLHVGYNQVLINEEDIHKTAIATPFGHFEWVVMGLGMTNAPSTFQTLMNDVFRTLLFDFVVVFLDDILVFSTSFDEHLRHLRAVFDVLREQKLFAKPSKCIFGAKEVKFLGHIISGTELKADPGKLECVASWKPPTQVGELRTFLGFANYFRRFIQDFAAVAEPLDRLLKKYESFVWGSSQQEAFDALRVRLLTAPVLRLPDVKRQFRVDTDASDTRVAAVLLQQWGQEWHPVSYISRRLTDAETRYTTSEKEALAAVWALTMWRLYLFAHFELMTDNRTLAHLQSKPQLTRREMGWVDFLAEFDFDIIYRRGVENGAADALSRADSAGVSGEMSAIESVVGIAATVIQEIKDGYKKDKFFVRILEDLSVATGSGATKSCFSLSGELLWRVHDDGTRRVCIPLLPKVRLLLLQQFHDCVIAGHAGRERTFSRIQRTCFWPDMYKDVRKFVRSCDSCQRVKSVNQPLAARLQPLPIPEDRWESVSLDLVTDLPKTKSGLDSIVTFTDRLSKRVHLAAIRKAISASQLARVFVDKVFVLHGMPRSLVSDRDPRFTSEFWNELFRLLGTKLQMSTANHPQTDGQSEATNKTVEQTLRAFVNYRMDNWDELLPLVEFAINDSVQTSSGMSPFFADTGRHPVTPATLLVPMNGGQKLGDAQRFLDHQAAVLREVKDNLVVAQQRQIASANVHRRHRIFQVGDLVLVSTDYLLSPEQRQRPKRKLLPTWQGPWEIVEVVSHSAYRLRLPVEVKAHPVLSVEALRRYVVNEWPDREVPPPPPVPSFDDPTEMEEEVEEVLDKKVVRGRVFYLAKWAGKPLHEATWLPEANFCDEDGTVTDALLRFQAR